MTGTLGAPPGPSPTSSSRPNIPSIERLKRLDEFSVHDLECVRLALRGDSVIDWHRLNLKSDQEVRELLLSQEMNPDLASDRARIDAVKSDSIAYLRRAFEYPIPKPVENATIEELLWLASSSGHRQMCACTILKCMHIIHHVDGRELLFMLPMSDKEVFNLVEEKVYRVIGNMLAGGFPITEFIGGRKHKDSLYTKLMSKQETTAAQVFDKLRFRIVTKNKDDIFPVVEYLNKKLFPFNYVVPGQSINSMFQFKSYCQKQPRLAAMLPEMQAGRDSDLTPSDNIFSAENYRVIHFVVDMPVRLPKKLLDRAPPAARVLGPIVFVICEFQVIDRETEAANEIGDASHARYKERQKKAVMRRLQLGMREMKVKGRVREPEPVEPEAVAPPPVTKRSPAKGPSSRRAKR